jgi:putative membrane protein
LVTRLTADEKKRIEAAVSDAESRTHAHVAVSIIPASDRYVLYPIAWGALAAILTNGVLALIWPRLPLREAFAIQALVFVSLSILLEWRPLRMRLVPPAVRRHRARTLAHREFAARILATSERKGGVLFFVSLAERYAEILADHETQSRVGNAAWEKILGDYISGAQSGPVADAIVAAVRSCAAVLHHAAESP